MRILLDTHAFLWWVANDPNLSATAHQTIGNGSNEVFFSAASSWEIAIKAQIGKLMLPANLEQFISSQLAQNNFTVLPIHISHTLGTYRLPMHHRDPFDRILVAQSQLEAIPIVTADPLIAQYGVQTIW